MKNKCSHCGMLYEQAYPMETYEIDTDDGDTLLGKRCIGAAHCSSIQGHDFSI